jgi:hypothetical protein
VGLPAKLEDELWEEWGVETARLVGNDVVNLMQDIQLDVKRFEELKTEVMDGERQDPWQPGWDTDFADLKNKLNEGLVTVMSYVMSIILGEAVKVAESGEGDWSKFIKEAKVIAQQTGNPRYYKVRIEEEEAKAKAEAEAFNASSPANQDTGFEVKDIVMYRPSKSSNAITTVSEAGEVIGTRDGKVIVHFQGKKKVDGGYFDDVETIIPISDLYLADTGQTIALNSLIDEKEFSKMRDQFKQGAYAKTIRGDVGIVMEIHESQNMVRLRLADGTEQTDWKDMKLLEVPSEDEITAYNAIVAKVQAEEDRVAAAAAAELVATRKQKAKNAAASEAKMAAMHKLSKDYEPAKAAVAARKGQVELKEEIERIIKAIYDRELDGYDFRITDRGPSATKIRNYLNQEFYGDDIAIKRDVTRIVNEIMSSRREKERVAAAEKEAQNAEPGVVTGVVLDAAIAAEDMVTYVLDRIFPSQ